jgi:hypothetical protein
LNQLGFEWHKGCTLVGMPDIAESSLPSLELHSCCWVTFPFILLVVSLTVCVLLDMVKATDELDASARKWGYKDYVDSYCFQLVDV